MIYNLDACIYSMDRHIYVQLAIHVIPLEIASYTRIRRLMNLRHMVWYDGFYIESNHSI